MGILMKLLSAVLWTENWSTAALATIKFMEQKGLGKNKKIGKNSI